jgi:hypothetical protein
MVARYRSRCQSVIAQFDLPDAVRLRRSNDAEGDVGCALVLLVDDARSIPHLVKALSAMEVSARGRDPARRDWHVYAEWEQILEKKSSSPSGYPFTFAATASEYRADMCPKTLDFTARALVVSISPWWTDEQCTRVAEAITRACRAAS